MKIKSNFGKGTRALSMLLAVLMTFSVMAVGAVPILDTVAKAWVEISNIYSDITVVVPETIYLKPNNSNSVKEVQYYVNNTLNGNNVTLDKVSDATSGKVYFKYKNAKSLKIKLNGTTGGTFSSLTSVTVNNGLYQNTSFSAGQLSQFLAQGATRVLEWEFIYTIDDPNSIEDVERTVYAYTVAYSPQSKPHAAAASSKNDASKDSYASHLLWIEGMQAKGPFEGTAARVKDNDDHCHTISSAKSDVFNPPAGILPHADDGSHRAGYFLTDDANGNSYHDLNYVSDSGTWVTSFSTAMTGLITVDTSRYNNMNQVPNVKYGFLITDFDNTDKRRSYKIWVYSGTTFIYGYYQSDANHNSNSLQGKTADDHTLIHQHYEASSDKSGDIQESWNYSRIRFYEKINIPISGEGELRRAIKGNLNGAKSSSWASSITYCPMKIQRVNKSALRSLIKSTSTAIKNKDDYKPELFATFKDAFKKAYGVLGNPLSSKTECDNAATELQNAFDRLERKAYNATEYHYYQNSDGDIISLTGSNKVYTFDLGNKIVAYPNNYRKHIDNDPSKPEEEKYVFSYAMFNNKKYQGQDIINNGIKVTNAKKDLEFKFYYRAAKYKVRFYYDIGSQTYVEQEFSWDSAPMAFRAFSTMGYSMPGYHFVGWKTANASKTYEDGTYIGDLNDTENFVNNPAYAGKPKENYLSSVEGQVINLYCDWQPDGRYFRFNKNGNSVKPETIKTQNVTASDTDIPISSVITTPYVNDFYIEYDGYDYVPENIRHCHFKFLGWAIGNAEEDLIPELKANANETVNYNLNADNIKQIGITYPGYRSLGFHWDDGVTNQTIDLYAKWQYHNLTLWTPPAKEGASFAGWYSTNDDNEISRDIAQRTNDAIWEYLCEHSDIYGSQYHGERPADFEPPEEFMSGDAQKRVALWNYFVDNPDSYRYFMGQNLPAGSQKEAVPAGFAIPENLLLDTDKTSIAIWEYLVKNNNIYGDHYQGPMPEDFDVPDSFIDPENDYIVRKAVYEYLRAHRSEYAGDYSAAQMPDNFVIPDEIYDEEYQKKLIVWAYLHSKNAIYQDDFSSAVMPDDFTIHNVENGALPAHYARELVDVDYRYNIAVWNYLVSVGKKSGNMPESFNARELSSNLDNATINQSVWKYLHNHNDEVAGDYSSASMPAGFSTPNEITMNSDYLKREIIWDYLCLHSATYGNEYSGEMPDNYNVPEELDDEFINEILWDYLCSNYSDTYSGAMPENFTFPTIKIQKSELINLALNENIIPVAVWNYLVKHNDIYGSEYAGTMPEGFAVPIEFILETEYAVDVIVLKYLVANYPSEYSMDMVYSSYELPDELRNADYVKNKAVIEYLRRNSDIYGTGYNSADPKNFTIPETLKDGTYLTRKAIWEYLVKNKATYGSQYTGEMKDNFVIPDSAKGGYYCMSKAIWKYLCEHNDEYEHDYQGEMPEDFDIPEEFLVPEGFVYPKSRYYAGMGGDQVEFREETTLYATWDDFEAPVIVYDGGRGIRVSNNFNDKQTVSVDFTDNVKITGYYWGTNRTYDKNIKYPVDIANFNYGTLKIEVSSPGTYYITLVDGGSNISKTYPVTVSETKFYLAGGTIKCYDGAEYRNVTEDCVNIITERGKKTVAPKPVRDGYVFVGWYNAPNNGAKVGSPSADGKTTTFSVDSNTRVYAVWKPNFVMLDENYQDEDGNAVSINYFAPPENINIKDKGLTTLYCNRGEDQGKLRGHDIFTLNGTLSEDVEICTASFTPSEGETYIITYDILETSGDFEGDGSIVLEFVNSIGEVVGEAHVLKSDYTDAGRTRKQAFNAVTASKVAGIRLRLEKKNGLKFNNFQFRVKVERFVDSNRKFTYSIGPKLIKTTGDKTLPIPYRPGYNFRGWYKVARPTAGMAPVTTTSGLSDGTTLYAKWEARTYKVSYDYNHKGLHLVNNTPIPTASFIYDQNKALATTNVSGYYLVKHEANGGKFSLKDKPIQASDYLIDKYSRAEAEFLGWSTDRNAVEPMYLAGQTCKNISTEGNDITLYAVWKFGSVELPSATKTELVNGKVLIYTLRGWFDRFDNGNMIGVPGDFYVPKGDESVYARWTPFNISSKEFVYDYQMDNKYKAVYSEADGIDSIPTIYKVKATIGTAVEGGQVGSATVTSKLTKFTGKETYSVVFEETGSQEVILSSKGITGSDAVSAKIDLNTLSEKTNIIFDPKGYQGEVTVYIEFAYQLSRPGMLEDEEKFSNFFTCAITFTPANSVYYEETVFESADRIFQDNTGSQWNDKVEAGRKPGDSDLKYQAYGFSPKYNYDDEKMPNFSYGTYTQTTVSKTRELSEKKEFSFTGNGFELISACGPNTAGLMIFVWRDCGTDSEPDYRPVEQILIDTRITDANLLKKGLLHQVPVYQFMSSERGKFLVQVCAKYVDDMRLSPAANGNRLGIESVAQDLEQSGLDIDRNILKVKLLNDDINQADMGTLGIFSIGEQLLGDSAERAAYIDGIRVYNPIIDEKRYYSWERNATFYNIRQFIKTNDYTEYQVQGNNADILNEIYLAPRGKNNAVSGTAFSINNFKKDGRYRVYISLRAVGKEAEVTVCGYVEDNQGRAKKIEIEDIKHSTEMYYDITDVVESNGTIIIVNEDKENYVAIGNIKITSKGDEEPQFTIKPEGGSKKAKVLMMMSSMDDLQTVTLETLVETDEPGTDEPGTDDPGTDDPGTGDPGTDEPKPKASITIPNAKSSYSVDYKTMVTVYAKAENIPEGGKIVWYSADKYLGEGDSYTVKATQTFKIKAKVVNANQVAVAESQEVKVSVKAGFIQKLIAFFLELFDALQEFYIGK